MDALSVIVHRDVSFHKGQRLVSKMKEIIPRQLFEVPIQAAMGNKVISRANVKAMRKDVLAKCYGGDISQKTQTSRKAEGGQETHEDGGLGGDSAGGVYVCFAA